ncbi:NAD(P)-binding protein [Myriangium duriaei CBS 260.36]|uniref:NAD(P)-binding protein n=1 Tax=Myriangium duriaei CBS 260.36 TaxID=1168546 RepID=A0A9P4J403_9PEZI|nr:NAD(P)-binding protein [Myriangium duriaei CBS 260.36]
MPTAIAIKQVPGKPGEVYYPLEHISLPTPTLGANDVEVSLLAAALNHRDLFIRQHLYPGTAFSIPLLADGCGIVVRTGSSSTAQSWHGKRVILNPGLGWKDDAEGPEDPKGYQIMGGTKYYKAGTLAESIVVPAAELEFAPEHLSAVQAAALPLTGLTAWRATVTKSGNAKEGRNILITGIGGGVALMALEFAAAAGANVYVTSGSEEKLKKAKELGAKGGVSYKEKGWEKKLLALLPKERPLVDAIIDGAGGDVMDKAQRVLKAGGVVVSYGMTVGPKMPFQMGAVLKNIELRGSTMGSRKEFADMVRFVTEKKVVPVVSRSVKGLKDLSAIDGLFEDMKNASQFGKLVVEIESEDGVKSKL